MHIFIQNNITRKLCDCQHQSSNKHEMLICGFWIFFAKKRVRISKNRPENLSGGNYKIIFNFIFSSVFARKCSLLFLFRLIVKRKIIVKYLWVSRFCLTVQRMILRAKNWKNRRKGLAFSQEKACYYRRFLKFSSTQSVYFVDARRSLSIKR